MQIANMAMFLKFASILKCYFICDIKKAFLVKWIAER